MSNDLVSRQWLLDEYDKRHKGPPGGARKLIEEAPPADVRPVVYCKDCVHWKEHPFGGMYCSVFDWINSSTGLDFCSFAERHGAEMRETP